MRILVTGGAGFIGSHVVDAYVEAGHEVYVVDDLSSGRREFVNERATLIPMNIGDPRLSDVLSEVKPEVVNHHAAQPSVKVSVDDPLFDAQTNVLGLINVLEASRRAGVRKVIYIASGGAMYGEPEYLPIDEEHPVRPQSPYAATKAVGEHYLHFYEREYGLAWTSLRYANVYGPRQDPFGEAGVVAIFTQQLLSGETPVIHWDGEQQRDFVYVGDCVRANLLVLDAGDGRAYNIGTGRGVSVNELYNTLCQVIGVSVTPARGPRRPGDIRYSYLDCTRIHRELGWQAEVDLVEGLRRTVAYFRQQPVSSRELPQAAGSREEAALARHVSHLLALDEEALYAELGARLQVLATGGAQAASRAVGWDMFTSWPMSRELGPDLARFGRAWLSRFTEQLYHLMCDEQDPDYHRFRDAFEEGVDAFAVFLASTLVSHFAWLPAVAVVVASLLAKRVLTAGYDAACEAWKEALLGHGTGDEQP